jgi:acyl carrier protein
MKTLEEIKQIIKQDILIDRLELEDITAEEIDDNEPLFGAGLGLDSVEALDVVAGLEEEFNVKLSGISQEELADHFSSVQKLAEFIFNLLNVSIKA